MRIPMHTTALVLLAGCSELSVVSLSPESGAMDVSIFTNVSATLDAELDPSTVTSSAFTLALSGGGPVDGTVSSSGAVATFEITGILEPGSQYTATLADITSVDGNGLANPLVWSFITEGENGGGSGGGGGTGGGVSGTGGGVSGTGGGVSGTGGGASGTGGGATGTGGGTTSGTCRTYPTDFNITTTGGPTPTSSDSISNFNVGTKVWTETLASGGTKVSSYASVADFVDEAEFMEGLGGPQTIVVTADGGTTTITCSYDGQRRRTGFSTRTQAASVDFVLQVDTYDSWDNRGRPLTGSADVNTPLGAGDYCEGMALSFTYNDNTRVSTRTQSGGTNHATVPVDWCTNSASTTTNTYDSHFISITNVHNLSIGTRTDTWTIRSTAMVCK